MVRHSSVLHLIIAITVALSVFQPLIDSTPQGETEDDTPAVGSVVISLIGSDGSAVGGACFDVLDVNGGVSSVCDGDGDGTASLGDLPAGPVTVRQTSAVAGYDFAPEGYGTVPAGDTGYVTLTAPVVIVPTEEPQPTEAPEPTAEPDPTETLEPTEDPEIPVAAADIGIMAAGDISIACQHQAGSSGSTFGIEVEDIPGDVQPFSITIVPYDLQGNPLPPQEYTSSPVILDNENWRRIDITVQFSDGTTGTAIGGCNTDPIDTSITTTPYTADGQAIPDGGAIDPGTAMYDTAVLSGQSVDAAGTVTYYLYDSADCSGDPVFVSGPLDVVDGVVPDSGTYTPTSPGNYEWVVVYSGDIDQGNPQTNSHFNGPAESGCGEESVIVGQVDTSVTTTMMTEEGEAIPQEGTIPYGTGVYDTAIINGATEDATGTVTYTLYSGNCPGTPVPGATFTVDVANGVVPDSGVVSDLPIGTYNWVVSYSGDDKNAPSESACGDETFSIDKAEPTVTTTMFDTDDNEIADGAVVPVGTSMYDTATIDGYAEPLTGTVTYALYDSADCTGTPVAGPFEVEIGPDGTIPPSPNVDLDSTGTYNWVVTYSGNDANEDAISDCGSETVNVEPASPDITTEIFNADDDSVVDVGSVIPEDSSVYDTATLDGATDDATGTVTFYLYNNFTCTGEPYYEVTVELNEDGTIPPTPPVGPLPGGTWNWVAVYSGDENNNPASTSCGDEEFFIGQGEGGITTMVEDENGNQYPDGSEVEVDTVLRDTAVLDGVTPDAGGTVTFYLYEGADCSSDPIFTSEPVDVVNGELVGPSGTYTFENQGTYQWVASYSGDDNNAAVSSPCGAETIVVVGKPSSVTTVMYEGAVGGTEVPNNGRVLEGTTVFDTAILDPADATGTFTFDLYDNANCSGDPIQVFADVAVDTDAWPSVTLSEPGTYNWVVTYSGDDDYAASASTCSSETFYIALQPTITTMMVDENGEEIPNNATLQAGDLIGDTAVLDGATDDASGTVTYNFYLGPDCSGTPIFAPQVTVTNGEVPPSGVVEPPFLGEWSIQAVYSGNNTNFPATSECGTENFTIDPASTPTISTTMRADGEVIPHNGEIRFLPADVTDTVNLFGVVPGSTGTVTFELYKSADCSGDAVFTDIQTDVEITTTTLSFTSDSYAISTAEWGTYNWVVTWDGDLNGDGETDTLVSGCGEETFVGVTQNEQTVTIGCTYNATTQLTTFRVLVAKPTTADPDIDPELIVVATPTDNFLNPLDPITYHAYDSSNPESGVNFIAQPWRQLTVAVTWPDGQTGSAFANCNTNKLTPELTTAMFAVPETPIENGSTVEIGTEVYDTAVLTDGTTRWSGTLTYTLYNSADCAIGTEVGTAQVFTLDPNDTTLPPSAPVPISLPGTYNWVVSYSGDDNNQPADSGCGEEFFSVDPVEVSVLTQVYLASDDSTVPDDATVPFGTVIYDTTTLEGALASVSGDVTYTLYTTEDCTGDVAYTETVTIANGTVPPSGQVTVDQAGTWNWVVSYGGDQVHAAATSACGDETVLVSKATPTITTLLSTEEASAGDEVYDTAILSGASADASGTVTYVVYANRGCFGEPLYTFDPVTVENGVVPNSPAQVFDTPGHYEWQAFYSGDDNNEPATSVCGTEPLDILAPDVVVDKTAGDLLIPAGDEASFTITVSNTGSGNAYDVVVTDVLPAGIEWTIDPAVEGCAVISGTLECAFDVIEPGESISITVVGTTDPADCGFLTNVASASASNEPNTVLANNSDGATLRVNCPDLQVRKTTDTPVVNASDEVQFSIEVRNVGLGQAQNVTLTDTLPAGNAWTIDPANEDCAIAEDGVTLTCEIGTLTFGQAFTVGIVGETNPQECGLLVNTVTVEASNEAETALANNVDEVEVLVLCPELVVFKTNSSGVVSAGDLVSYTITVANLGEGTAYNVVMTDTLPAGIDWTIDPAVEGCSIADDGVTLTCSFGDVPSGTSIPVTVTGVTDAADCGLLLNRALVEGDNEDGEGEISNQSNLSRIEVLCADILVEKSAGADEISAGDAISFTITVTNLGPGEAYDVTIDDALNPAIDDWAIDPAVEGCEIADATLDCEFAVIDPYTAVNITVVGITDAADCGVIDNTATGTASNESENATSNNSGSASVEVLCPDLAIEKTTDTPIVSAGDPISYTIVVSNIGEGRADGVVLDDTLPAGISWEIDPAVEGCSITGGDPETLGCDIGTMQPGETFSVTLVGITNAGSCGVVTNTATVDADNELPQTPPVLQWQSTGATNRLLAQDLPVDENNSSSVDVQVLCPDVTVEKTAANTPISAGDQASFTITVSNIGEGNAYDVQVVDDLPGDIDWAMTPSVSGCAIANGALDCTFAVLTPGASIDIVVAGTTNASSCGVLLNEVDVSASNEIAPQDDEPVDRSVSIREFGRVLAQEEPSPTDNNSASASIEVLCPEITVEKTTDTPVVSAGDQLSFTMTVSNVGEGNAYGVVLYDLLPEGIEWIIEPPVDGCSIAANGVTLTCDVGTLGPGESFAVTVVGEASPERCGVIINLAVARATNEPADDELLNADLATAEILCPDIVVEKTADTPVVSAGDEIGFTISVNNVGEGTAYDVDLSDELPSGIEWTIDPANANCEILSESVLVLNCEIGELLPGEEFTVSVIGETDPTDCGVISNLVVVSASNEPNDAIANDEATAELDVLCPDVEVVKTAGDTPVSAGDPISFSLTVSNVGQGRADDVELTDTLPAGFDWVIDPAVDGCAITGDVLNCAIGTLESGEEFEVVVTSVTDPADCGELVNVASATASNESDTDLGNNEDSATVDVLCPDLEVLKTAANTPISAGDEASFTVTVSNIGEGNAYDVQLSDPLPAGVEWTIDPPVDGCAITDNVMTCVFGTLVPGQAIDITVIGTPTASACGVLLNVATGFASNEALGDEPVGPTDRVGWMQADDVTANNQATAEIMVLCPDIVVEKTAADDSLTAGDLVSFTITVTNVGEGNAYDVVITDELPAGFNWRADSEGATCEAVGTTLTCTIAELTPGASVDIVVSAPTTTSNCGSIVNVATGSASNEPDDATGNNTSDATVTIECPPPVTPTPSVTPDTPGTPIHTLPVTGDGGAAGASLPTWGLLGAAFFALATAITLFWGVPIRKR